jgi:hypothetical protein
MASTAGCVAGVTVSTVQKPGCLPGFFNALSLGWGKPVGNGIYNGDSESNRGQYQYSQHNYSIPPKPKKARPRIMPTIMAIGKPVIERGTSDSSSLSRMVDIIINTTR